MQVNYADTNKKTQGRMIVNTDEDYEQAKKRLNEIEKRIKQLIVEKKELKKQINLYKKGREK